MSTGYSTQALPTSHADLITSLSFSSSSPSLLVSTSLDGWIRIHARCPGTSSSGANRSDGANGQQNDGMSQDEDEDVADNGEQDEWVEVGSSKANEGPVWKAAWGPREYGTSLLVSIAGSVVHVWETQEQQVEGQKKLALVGRATLVEARGSMRDVAFTPSEFGLKLASISADSHLRIYECLDPSSAGLTTWSLLEDIELLHLPNTYYSPASSSHASHLRQQPQTQLIKGFDEQGSISSRGSALGPSGGSSASLDAQSASSSTSATKGAGRIESSGAWAVAYCQEAWWGECLAVSAGKEGLVRIIHFTPSSYWSQIAVLSPPNSTTASPVSTLAWAPSCGRSYHLIASGARDGCVRIWKVTPTADSASPWEASLAAEITEHMDGSSGGVGKVEWNITGTVLSTAGCDGVVRLWKAGYSGEWRVMSSISCDGQGEESSSSRRR